ncbi:SusE domain-containing protein [Pedobacter fastidiosus]|uniref:SusE domain-containing protein n=1 Tax=Pedobacter fastidiosus TaxID=2765361 RepID=A0ABR7KTG7_9SPHI|nr:SusE domain-containing protein [Pedobacter fastidiosus]MBC6111283.1 SusE domain-containing protein [Pedobacter fastidiosus]
MKKLSIQIIFTLLIASLFFGCKKDASTNIVTSPSVGSLSFKSSASNVVLSATTDATNVVTFSFKAANFGVSIIPTYSLEFDLPSDTSGINAWGNAIAVKLPSGILEKAYLGADFNSLLANQLMLPTGSVSTLAVRLKAEVNQNTGTASVIKPIYSSISITVNPYKATIEYPALLLKGGNSWKTPTVRTNGFILTSAKFNSKYEGYLNLPNADGYGGDAFQLVSSKDATKVYGWGGTSTTMSLTGGNLYLSPAPAYMKVNADVDALTINYTAVKFFISGDDNGWSTSSTPMIYNATTGKLVAANVSLTAGKTFVFTCNGGYDISYKVDATGALVYAGAPTWGGINIPVAKTGVFTVTLDLSAGDGNYTYSVK